MPDALVQPALAETTRHKLPTSIELPKPPESVANAALLARKPKRAVRVNHPTASRKVLKLFFPGIPIATAGPQHSKAELTRTGAARSFSLPPPIIPGEQSPPPLRSIKRIFQKAEAVAGRPLRPTRSSVP